MNNLFDIRDYVVVITGGTGVLGRCIGKYLALNGAKVVLLGRKAEVGAEIVADIQAEGGNAKFMKCDVMNQEMVQATCDAIVAEYGLSTRFSMQPEATRREPQSAPNRTSSIWMHPSSRAYSI